MARESQLDVALRSVWVRALVALVLAVIAGFAWWAIFTYLNDELDLPFVAWPVGVFLAIAFYYGIGLIFRRAGPRATPIRQTTGNLGRRLRGMIDHLTPLSFRSHRLGKPWPIVVVSQNAVTVTRPLAMGGTLRVEDGIVLHDGRPVGGPEIAEIRRLVATLREVLPQLDVGLPVQGLVVVDDATVVPSNLTGGDHELLFCHPDQLEGPLTLGPPHGADEMSKAIDAIARWRPEPR